MNKITNFAHYCKNEYMKRIFFIDAYALIYRSYFAFIKNPRINSQGLNTSAILGFVNTIEDILKREKPTHLGVAFDPAGPTFRHEAFEAYKAQRESTPEDIKKAVPYIKTLLKAYNIPIYEVSGYEADDVIGTLAKQAAKQGFTVYMLTPDKDYGQLVEENIFMYRPKHSGGYEILGVEEVKAKYGLENQAQVIDLLGLMGDSSDNIPGCPGVGEKTAVKLLQEFGSIENLLANTESLKGALKTKVESNIEQIKFSRFLATIKTDTPISLNEEELVVKSPNTAELLNIFQELEFRTLISKYSEGTAAPAALRQAQGPKKSAEPKQLSLFDLFDEADTQAEIADETAISDRNSIKNTPHNYTLVESSNFADFIGNLSTQNTFCFDTETTGLDVYNDKLLGLSFSWKETEGYYIPVNESNKGEILEALKPIFENPNTKKIGQNMKFDLMV
ncbi:MAG: 5'-3' exonuclease H3TH domain-containing protein, partial [Paludibacteraceae bacterium]|nr:5'-3' exonuclease H3TH domain-containing protein [Paludibacteraceae bacterium]